MFYMCDLSKELKPAPMYEVYKKIATLLCIMDTYVLFQEPNICMCICRKTPWHSVVMQQFNNSQAVYYLFCSYYFIWFKHDKIGSWIASRCVKTGVGVE